MSHVRRTLLPLLAVASGAALYTLDFAAMAKEEPEPVTVRFAAYNVNFGAELGPAIGALLMDPPSVPGAVGQVWSEVLLTDFEVRAEAIADQIELAAPDVVGLPEMALWRIQEEADSISEHPKPAKTVAFDFLKILLRALKARDLHYRAVVVANNLDVEMPGIVGQGLSDIRLTDRDVILVRRGVSASRPRKGAFAAQLVLPVGDGLPVTRSWTSVDVKVGGRKFRVVETHLEDGYEDIQRAQLAEILAGPAATDLPVVLLGDFNSDPENGYAPLVHADVLAAGFGDSWTEVTDDPGLTWGHVPLHGSEWTPFTFRLDYVFHSGGITALDADLLGEDAADRVGGLWPSDHAGLFVELQIQ